MTQIWWFSARSAGIVSWGLLSASTVWGLIMSTKLFRRKPRPAWLLDTHRFLGGLAVVFIGIHVLSIFFDSFVTFTLKNLFVPFSATWHPVAVSYGIVAMYMILAVEGTSLIRKNLSNKFWRNVHFLSFPLFVLATIHGISAGTDTTTLATVATMTFVFIPMGALTAVRIKYGSFRPKVARDVFQSPIETREPLNVRTHT